MAVIMITGCSTGIGQEAALHMARKGHDVYAAVRSPETADELREKISAETLSVEIIKLDLLDPASIDASVAAIVERSGRIDALVNNAGVGAGHSIEETPLDTVRYIFETNYFGTVSVLRAVTPVMRKQGSGRIVNVGSLAGRVPMGCHAHYSASKWAMEGLSESLAFEMAEFNVKVSVVEPGCVLTPMWTKGEAPSEESPYGNSYQRLFRFFEFNLERPAMPSDVAEAIADAIESDKPRFRYPVGHDAVESTTARASVSDEEWIEANCLPGDAFAERMAELIGVDYYRDK